ncbi:hypothetical protein AVEN_268623-1 [Araneus ventricosus]|uniref:Uncharacterized protein n=1 Tax=Araneus ventricosus TaxID=182803 RepID=A0A4Y2W1C1_ARAVE|nr:hypothetical protein AVEN_239029-1 [Araneus ventricosus]GBO29817.1 hypothetical protein AVEN_268623-1 [Araneus ventricosus]
MTHQILWSETGVGLLRSPPNGLEQPYGECSALSLMYAKSVEVEHIINRRESVLLFMTCDNRKIEVPTQVPPSSFHYRSKLRSPFQNSFRIA